MKKLPITILLFVLFAGCNSKTENTLPLTFAKAIGTYEGLMPCADCAGIFTHLELLDSVTFLKETRYVGKSRKVFHSRGNWHIVNDTTLQLNSSGINENYTYKNGKLLLQSSDGKNINDASLMQAMYKTKITSDSTFVLEGNGDNANWRLLANQEKLVFIYNNNDSVTFIKPVYENTESEIKISAEKDKETIKISLKSLGCISSNNTFQTYITQISWKENLYNGCSDFYNTKLLHGKWVAEEISGWSFNKETKQEQIPYIFFNPFTKSVTGFTGCNRFSSTYMQNQNELKFGATLATKMYCSGSSENYFFQALKDATQYELRSETLVIKKDETVLMVLHAE
jgi:heat shock protein HslJ